MAGKPFFVKPLPFTVAATGNERAGNLASHLAAFKFPGMTWRSNGNTGLTVDVDLGAAVTVDYVALLATNAQAGTTIQILMGASLANVQGGSPTFDSGILTLISPAVTGRDTYHSHYEFGTAQTYRYLRIKIASHTGDFEASTLVIGKKVQSSRYYEPEWENGPLDLSEIGDNRNGIASEAPGLVMRQISFTLGWLNEAEWETLFQPLLQALGKTEPVLLSFDPDATTYRQNRTYFGRLAESRGRKRNYNRFEKAFDLKSFI